jgi:hypothetical protein
VAFCDGSLLDELTVRPYQTHVANPWCIAAGPFECPVHWWSPQSRRGCGDVDHEKYEYKPTTWIHLIVCLKDSIEISQGIWLCSRNITSRFWWEFIRIYGIS